MCLTCLMCLMCDCLYFVFVFCVLCSVFCVLCFVRNTKIDMVCQMTDCAKNVFGVITKKKTQNMKKKTRKTQILKKINKDCKSYQLNMNLDP